MTEKGLEVTCCIAGGGPAGMMLGLLLARAGVDVVVLEKHADFLRDFRGDTIHPSTLEVLHELDLLDEFLKLPHQKAYGLGVYIGNSEIPFADFSHLPTRCKFIAFLPQWDFLSFLAQHAEHYPGFDLHMRAEATDLIEESGRIVGLRAQTPKGLLEIRADLVVAADGRSSILREKAGLEVCDLGAPMDVLWFRLSRRPDDPHQSMGRFAMQQIFILINRGEYWQCGYVIPKGSIEQIRVRGIDAFHANITTIAPFVGNRVAELCDWNDLSLLTVRVDRLQQWYREGMLCIGDAAHAMSPVGGVGINLAIQDAVAAGNALAEALRTKQMAIAHLRDVISRRQGAVIVHVVPDTPAQKAGLQAGDVVVSVNGRPVRDASALRNAVGLMQVGDRVSLGVVRKGWLGAKEKLTVSVNLAGEAATSARSSELTNPRLGGVRALKRSPDIRLPTARCRVCWCMRWSRQPGLGQWTAPWRHHHVGEPAPRIPSERLS